MTGIPAPNIVLSLTHCRCTRSCKPSDCTCFLNGLRCTAACKLQSCSNMGQECDDNYQQLLYDDSDDEQDGTMKSAFFSSQCRDLWTVLEN